MIAECRFDQVLTVGKEHLVEALSPTHALLPRSLECHGLFIKKLRRCITDANTVNGTERGELNVLSQRVELPAVHTLDHAGRNEVARTRDSAGRLANITRVVEETGLAQIPRGVGRRDPRTTEVLRVAVAGDHMKTLVKSVVHLGNVITGNNVIGIENKIALKGIGILVENAIEAKVHDPALALSSKVITLIDNGAGLARKLRRVVGAGIGDHEDLDKLGRIILILDGANEVGNYGLLVMRRDKEGIAVEFFGLGRRDLATKGTDDKEDHLVQKADREQRKDNLVEDHDGCVDL